MNYRDIFVPKKNGLGWTFNYANPLSWLIIILFLLLVYIIRRKKINQFALLMKAYVQALFKK